MNESSSILSADRLQSPDFKFLEFVSGHDGGEIPLDWSRYSKERHGDSGELARKMVVMLINKGYLREVEYVTHAFQLRGALKLKMTEKGWMYMTEMKARMAKPMILTADGDAAQARLEQANIERNQE